VRLMPTAGALGDSASSPDLSDLSPTPSPLPRLRRRTTPLSTEFRLLLDASCNHRAIQFNASVSKAVPDEIQTKPRRRPGFRESGGGPLTSEVLALRFRSSGPELPLTSVCVLTGLAFALLLPGVPTVAGALSTMYMGGTIRFLRRQAPHSKQETVSHQTHVDLNTSEVDALSAVAWFVGNSVCVWSGSARVRAAAVAQSALQRGAASRERRHARRVRKCLAPQAAPHRLPPEETRVQAVVAQRALRVCRCPTTRVLHQSRGAHSHTCAISASCNARGACMLCPTVAMRQRVVACMTARVHWHAPSEKCEPSRSLTRSTQW